MEKSILKVIGMSCKSCAKIIEMELKDFGGVKKAEVDFSAKKAILEFDSGKTDISKIKNIIRGLGYQALDD